MLMNAELKNFSLSGKILDLGAGRKRSSYLSFIKLKELYEIISVDLLPDREPDIIADLEKSLPIQNFEYDHVLCFNLLEHIYEHKGLVREARRVLKSGGRLLGYVPFLLKFHPDPNDYFRYTEQGLKKILEEAGFKEVKIIFIGAGALTAGWSQVDYFVPKFFRWLVTYLVLFLDRIVLKLKPVFRNKYALGYIFVATCPKD